MRGEIVRALSSSSNGLSLAEVALSVGEPDLMKVSKNLSDLQHERVVEITGGKFRLSGSGRKAIIKGTISTTVPGGNEPSSKTPKMTPTGVSRRETVRVAALELHAAHIRERDDTPTSRALTDFCPSQFGTNGVGRLMRDLALALMDGSSA